jgi:hypothetical protein
MTHFAPGQRLRLAALGFAVAVLVALLALASRSSAVPSGEGPANAGPVIVIIHLVEIIGLAIEVLFILILIAVYLTSRRRPPKEDEEQIYHEPPHLHWAVKLLIVALPMLVLSGLLFALYRLLTTDQPLEPLPAGIAPQPPLFERGGFVDQVASNMGLGWWEVLIAVVLAGAAFIAILRVFRTPTSAPRLQPDSPQQARALATAIRAGLRDARLEPDPRRAVIAAYATMEQILAAQGFPRRAVEAPLEYMARLFAELDISGEAIRTLTDLFELARFSDHAISPAAKEQAISALVVIEQELQMAR